MDKNLGISVVLGAALGKGYFKTFESVKQKTARLVGYLAGFSHGRNK